ncbi:MAG: hypothetical protein WBB37_08040 [bacterium]
MKAIQIICMALLTVVLMQGAYGHPPTEVKVTFNQETTTLMVSVSHVVGKIDKHYIEKIVVELNDEEIITQKFSTQNSGAKQEVSYIIPGAQVGDTFSVTAYCNISGKKTETLLIEEETQNE